MKKILHIPTALTLTLSTLPLSAQPTPASTDITAQPEPTSTVAEASSAESTEKSKIFKQLEELTQQQELREAQLEAELAERNAEISKLQAERELLDEQQKIKELKQEIQHKAEKKAIEDLKVKLENQASIAESKAALAQSKLELELTQLSRASKLKQAEMEALKIDNTRNTFADSTPIYLDKPLKKDGTLVVSDRRISLNGPIFSTTADYITERIHFYNNKDKKKPIFIVINDSPGGSVMAGYRILKAMEGSQAPIHVIVKSFAASMAAAITTLAEESYAYPNALILHHQLSSSFLFTTMNLTQQKEATKEAQEWWKRLADPIAEKMGITRDEFIAKMYEKNSDGDWIEFATEAKKLKWVNHTVTSIQETGKTIHPDSVKGDDDEKDGQSYLSLKESKDSEGRPCMYLPRLNPHDFYFLYNPDSYYKRKH